MRRSHRVMLLAALLALLLSGASIAHAATLPGDPLTASPIAVAGLHSVDNPSAVYQVPLVNGQTLVATVAAAAGATTNFDPDLYLYAPGASTLDHTTAVVASSVWPPPSTDSITYVVPATGTYSLEIHAAEGSGPATLTWQIKPETPVSVYRFFNKTNGSHFYTSSAAERDSVISRLAATYNYEGVAYTTLATKNNQALFRFYNKRNGSHFYTVSAAERDNVIKTLSTVYAYEGPAYNVSVSGGAPLHRFYNTRNGSHFYTISEAERQTVQATLSHVYAYEGIAFYVGQ